MSLVHLAIRNRALTAVAATTGLITLAATADGFTRATGSFLDDKFAKGQEIVRSGFGSNSALVIERVTTLTLYTTTAPAVEPAAANRSLTVGFPSAFARENQVLSLAGVQWYAEESFEELTQRPMGISADSPVEFTGNMRFRVYAKADTGMLGLRSLAESVRDLFPKGWAATLADGSIVRTRNEFLPTATHLGVLDTGFSAYLVTIPWRQQFLS